MRLRPLWTTVLGLALSGCAGSSLHAPNRPPGRDYVQDFEGDSQSVDPGSVRLLPSVCKDMDLAQEHRPLRLEDFLQFLRGRGLKTSETRARADLVYVDVTGQDIREPLRFRVAILPNAGDAGRHLHIALLQHGKGRWGLHRSNLAVLGPEGSYDDIVAFAARTKLACWGVLTVAGLDDTYVIPGGYAEL
ncbi:MAG: hypothetical protein CVU63_03790 [Deltaproteobacteria bacterium HGW-Deltaproteobacteria-20]|nr:MAG: hypothetical protein CVU63_03790 [Deltaproteobacteria bacterium HGW-Deltaproteobacteria-20]